VRRRYALAAVFAALGCNALLGNELDESPSTALDERPDGGLGADAVACPPSSQYSTDAHNCGRCGRDCGGGACTSGQCEPYVIADSQPGASAWYIAVDETSVYWTSFVALGVPVRRGDGKVRSAPKLGGAARILANVSQSFDLVVDETHVFFTTEVAGGLYRVAKTGGDPFRLASGAALDVVRQANQLYFTGGNAVRELTLPDGLRTIAPAEQGAEGIAVDETHLFWMNHTGGEDAGILTKKPTADGGGAPVSFAAPGGRRLAIDEDAVYWTSSNPNFAVMRQPKAGGPAVRLIEAAIRFGSVVVDGAYVYAALEPEGRIVRVTKLGGVAEELARGLANPTGLAQDADALYFTEGGTGLIKRLRK
jgi:hypothetical protein